jgi:phospholipid/cholesterol/gamma-HCH transport system permease protein
MKAIAGPATSFQRTLEYPISRLLGAIISVGGRCLPRVLLGRPTVIERETMRHLLGFLSQSVLAAAVAAFAYGMAAAYGVLSYTASPAAFETLVLPQLGGAFLSFVIPFAIANLVVLKGVVAMTSDIASMRVSQEIDAIEAVGLHPAEMVFAPRALALIITAPALAVLSVYSAGLGAWVVSWIATGSGLGEFAAAFLSSLTSGALLLTVANLGITAVTMSIVSGSFGFVGAKGEQGFVGRITTAAMTTAVISIIIVNLFLSLLARALHLQ